jgi:putative oxygen-independent coproporphyrinogen III oxidase
MNIPLSLYVHIPWCVRKCPYCDFNSHEQKGELPEQAYVDALLADLRSDVEAAGGRPIRSVFFGGGTPSLFSPAAIGRFLQQADRLLTFAADAEITLEANPGTVEAGRFSGYRAAGVNRLSMGIQSLDDAKLAALGRIHGRAEALAAVQAAHRAGFDNFNLDLMYALPGQSLAQAEADLRELLSLQPPHVSWYQLTLEPNTLFHRHPPTLPDEESIGEIMDMGLAVLAEHGYRQYEVSAHAQPGRQSRHNLNYWEFGDYLAVGAGAHAKLSLGDGRIVRRSRARHPQAYMEAGAERYSERLLTSQDLVIEFMLNALRLIHGVPAYYFEARTGLSVATILPLLDKARQRGLLQADPARLQATSLGQRFLNDLLAIFEPD